MSKVTNIAQKVSASILVLVTLWIVVVSWLNYSFVSPWQGRVHDLPEKNVSLMAVFSASYWPLTIVVAICCATVAFYLFKQKSLPIVFNVALVFVFIVSAIFIHMLAVSTGFELHAIKE